MASSTFPSRPDWRRSGAGFASTTRKLVGNISGSAILRYRYAPDFDHSIVLDTDGKVIEQNSGRFLLGEVWMNKSGGVCGLTSARPSPPSASAKLLRRRGRRAPEHVLVPSRNDRKGILHLKSSKPVAPTLAPLSATVPRPGCGPQRDGATSPPKPPRTGLLSISAPAGP